MFSLVLKSNSWGKEVYQSQCNYLLFYDGDFDGLVANSFWENDFSPYAIFVLKFCMESTAYVV